MIQINGNLLVASLVRAGDKLTLGLTGNQPIDELLAMLNPATAPEIRVLDDAGGTVAIYRGHALTAVTIVPGEPRRITATLQVQPIELAEMMTADNNGGEGTDNGGDLSAADQSGKADA